MPVYRLAVSMLDDPAEADDATQDALAAAISRLDTSRGDSSFTTWLYAIALNVCRGRLRKRRARERLVKVLESLIRGSGQNETLPEQVAIRRETDMALWRAVRALDDKLREVIILRYFQELRLEDIAATVGVSERAIRDRLHRAHERMRGVLAERVDSR